MLEFPYFYVFSVKEYLAGKGACSCCIFVSMTVVLRKGGLILLDWCCLCKRNGGSVNHLLLHCSLACELWSMVFGLFGVQWGHAAKGVGSLNKMAQKFEST